MSDYICIDGGTTNTRLRLVRDEKIVDTISLKIGVVTAGGDPEGFGRRLKSAIDALLERNAAEGFSIRRILASGMITSDLGLYTLAHGKTPAGIRELHENAREVVLPEISPIPFVFIRGLKTGGNSVDDTDVMRGEETELMGIQSLCGCGACTYILPGSHNKVIYTDEQGRIIDFFTTLTGEMIASLAGYTILKNSVDLEDAVLDEKYLLEGYEYCRTEGINKALFKVRISDTMFKREKSARYSFFLGAILFGEIAAILKKASGRIVIGGRQQLRQALYTLLKRESDLDIICLAQEETDACVAIGAIRIYEYEGR